MGVLFDRPMNPSTVARDEPKVGQSNAEAFQATTPGMSVMTLEVPAVQDKDAWNSFLNMLSISDGLVILRPTDTAEYDPEGYLYKSEVMSQIFEVVDSRPMFIVCDIKGPIRGSMMFFPAISTLVLATKDSTFGFPDSSQEKVHQVTFIALRKRLTDVVQRRLFLVGDTIDVFEAQRLGLVDYVGSDENVENEVCRLVYRNCSPKTEYVMHKQKIVGATKAEPVGQED